MEDNEEKLKGASTEPVPVSNLRKKEQRELKRIIHGTIQAVTRDIEVERQFNTGVARLMELLNALSMYEPKDHLDWSLMREGIETLLVCLSPYTPHVCEELWEKLGHDDMLAETGWPEPDPEALAAEEVTIVVQVNGKVRESINVPAGLSEENLKERVLMHEGVRRRLEGKEIKKVIVVPDKLVSLVVKD